MPAQFSLSLIAALLLSNFVIAQYICLRPVKNISEAIGLSICTALTLLATTILDWPLTHFVLQPLGLIFLRTFIAILFIAVGAHIIEASLHRRYPKLFPVYGNFLPQIIIASLILILPLLNNAADTSFITQLAHALLFGAGAMLLLIVFQTLREHTATAEVPIPLRGAAIDMLSAGLLIAAYSGLAGIF
jgi:electron transport complex protein RnfA